MKGTLEHVDAERRPSKQETTESHRDQPVKRAGLISTTENAVQRRRVDDKHCKARAAKNSRKVVVVAYERKTEGNLELALDREYIEALG